MGIETLKKIQHKYEFIANSELISQLPL